MQISPRPRITSLPGDAEISTVPWSEISERIGRLWVPRDSPHHSLIGMTRSGKSYLAVNGILRPHAVHDPVLIIDVKGDDETLSQTGQVVKELPHRYRRRLRRNLIGEEPEAEWFRMVVSEDWHEARRQVRNALKQINYEGKKRKINWKIYADEIRALTDPKPPSLNLLPYFDEIWLRGGSRGIQLIAATQAPRWAPRSMYDQPQFHWIGNIEDEDAQKRLREIGGFERYHLPALRSLQRHNWIYTDRLVDADGRFRAITKVD